MSRSRRPRGPRNQGGRAAPARPCPRSPRCTARSPLSRCSVVSEAVPRCAMREWGAWTGLREAFFWPAWQGAEGARARRWRSLPPPPIPSPATHRALRCRRVNGGEEAEGTGRAGGGRERAERGRDPRRPRSFGAPRSRFRRRPFPSLAHTAHRPLPTPTHPPTGRPPPPHHHAPLRLLLRSGRRRPLHRPRSHRQGLLRRRLLRHRQHDGGEGGHQEDQQRV